MGRLLRQPATGCKYVCQLRTAGGVMVVRHVDTRPDRFTGVPGAFSMQNTGCLPRTKWVSSLINVISSSPITFFWYGLAALKAAFARPWAQGTPVAHATVAGPSSSSSPMAARGQRDLDGWAVHSSRRWRSLRAVELPSDLFWRQLALPTMSSEQLAQAIELDVKTLSPFSSQDLV